MQSHLDEITDPQEKEEYDALRLAFRPRKSLPHEAKQAFQCIVDLAIRQVIHRKRIEKMFLGSGVESAR